MADAILVDNGPYKFLRHPMYTAVITTATGLLLLNFTWIRLAIVLTLAIVLIVKLLGEEAVLTSKFQASTNYGNTHGW
ncbi:isoprenylcysteine carboxylmethyltransferase family protein [Ferruginibacter sp.]|uniref:methyltransferase family protein n=1 Tax=Ferruginibacter sp. TaxID=1940288 RepID=UPI003467E582